MIQEKNLNSLVGEFRDKGKAAKGFQHVSELIAAGKESELAHLLRNHQSHDVYGEELIKRFEVDTLLEFYNLLLIAALAGYIDPALNEKIRQEIKMVLSQRALKQYYINYYPYKLTEYCFAYVRFERYFDHRSNEISLSAFTSFISLSRMLKVDKEIERFLNMLDHVSYGDDSINDVNEILSSSSKLTEAILSKNKSADETAVLGFFKYTSFISQLKEILELLQEFPLLQSAMWLFHGYYFDRINIKMKDFFHIAFSNVEKALSSKETFENIAIQVYGEIVSDSISEMDLKEYAFSIVESAQKDVDYVLDKSWAKPIQSYFTGYL